MKSGREHVVPLSSRCIEILAKARKLSAGDLIFPDDGTNKPLSENRFLNARASIGYEKDQCSPHGFRSSFRDWAAEETNFPSEVVEMALAHTIKSKVEAAYRRGQLLAKRRELMEEWAHYVIRING
jgi:integrase